MNPAKTPATKQATHTQLKASALSSEKTPPLAPQSTASSAPRPPAWRHTCALIHMEQKLRQTNDLILHLENEIEFTTDEENRERIEAELLRALSKRNAVRTALEIALRKP
ncbi:hypothetical protein HW115_16495 [Verrucomicrobiaceae bacterium N1E253]|uniref:Uncharacterized protein n=1 Tax=Oceaniferula marina TaxID=2748318 RepID=A0A851GSK4_9BACT|nr:hypothetical protein [Oceaniferula marina]NWK57224.1 hypothetical protein [Oceaniferula marina]